MGWPSASGKMPVAAFGTLVAVAVAAVLWFIMFSPWTSGLANFWIEMSCSALILTALALRFSVDRSSLLKVEKPALQILLGIAIAVALWGVFFVGDRVSRLMFDFARPQVDSVYAMKTGLPTWLIAVLLLFIIGPAEELFWRCFVQRNLTAMLTSRYGDAAGICGQSRGGFAAFAITTAVYTLIHIWSFNFMLVMAALVAGFVWGLLYLLKPKFLPALIISHALWDAMVFVIFPI